MAECQSMHPFPLRWQIMAHPIEVRPIGSPVLLELLIEMFPSLHASAIAESR